MLHSQVVVDSSATSVFLKIGYQLAYRQMALSSTLGIDWLIYAQINEIPNIDPAITSFTTTPTPTHV